MDDSREFKLKLDDSPTDIDTDKTGEKRGRKDSPEKKTSFMLVVLFAVVVIGALLVWIYYHFQNQIHAINIKGTVGISVLSKEFNDKLSVLSRQFLIQKKETQDSITNLKIQIKELNSVISSLQSSTLSKKDFENAISGIEQKITPLQSSVETLTGQLTDMADQSQKMTVTINKIQTGVLNNKQEISTLDAIQIDRTEFEAALKKEREFHEGNFAHSTEALFSEIAALKEQIKKLNSQLGNTDSGQSSTDSTKTKTPSERISTPKSEEIVEQEIE